MKKAIIFLLFITFVGTCYAQVYYSPQEHHLLLYYSPIVTYSKDTEKEKPAGAEVFIPTGFLIKYSEYNTDSIHWTFVVFPSKEAIGIQTPILPYYGTTTMLKISDTIRTIFQSVPIDIIQEKFVEYTHYAKAEFKSSIPFLKKKRNRLNQIIRNDSLVIYLINIKPKNIDRFRKTVTMPVKEN